MNHNIVSIHQSQYLPWPPYFKKIALSDTFIILDNVQFQKNGVQNRNKIRNKNGDFWITLPVNNKLEQLINEKKLIVNNVLQKHWKMIEQSYSKTPNWSKYKEELQEIYRKQYYNLHEINITLIRYFLDVLKIDTKIIEASELNVDEKKNDLVIALCKKVNATVYLSGHGALDYLCVDDFKKENIELQLLESTSPIYTQMVSPFIANLSLLDFLMYANDEEIAAYFSN